MAPTLMGHTELADPQVLLAEEAVRLALALEVLAIPLESLTLPARSRTPQPSGLVAQVRDSATKLRDLAQDANSMETLAQTLLAGIGLAERTVLLIKRDIKRDAESSILSRPLQLLARVVRHNLRRVQHDPNPARLMLADLHQLRTRVLDARKAPVRSVSRRSRPLSRKRAKSVPADPSKA